MGKKQTVSVEELKVGDEVEIVIKTKVLRLDDGDEGVGFEGASDLTKWLWPSEHKDIKFRAPERPLVPDDAPAVSYKTGGGHMVFAGKKPDGVWVDSDGDRYETTEELIESIREFGKLDTVQVYDKRGA